MGWCCWGNPRDRQNLRLCRLPLEQVMPLPVKDKSCTLPKGAQRSLPESNQSSTGREMDRNAHSESSHGPEPLLELPHDLLWTILGFLDLRSLCTARLVCKQFRHYVSDRLKALQLDCTALEQPPTSTFTQLSGLTHLAVSVACEQRLYLLAHPRIAPIVTHVDLSFRMAFEDWQGTDGLDQLMLLPNLRSLSLQVREPKIKLLPDGLEELHLKHRMRECASLTRFSGLSSLGIRLDWSFGEVLQPLTSLRSLRSLELLSDSSALPTLSTFTMLTALTWRVFRHVSDSGPELPLHNLACLTALSHLTVRVSRRELRHEHVVCLSLLTRLTHLDMSESHLAECVTGSTFLVPLTGLVSLGLGCYSAGMSLLPSLNVEALQSLTLRGTEGDVSVLQRATGLTRLKFKRHFMGYPYGLEPAVANMSRLRSLQLCLQGEPRAPYSFHLSRVLRDLTSLTRLKYTGTFRAGRDLRACASLPGLRRLCFRRVREVTPACLPALQAMSGLTKLTLRSTGILSEHVTLEVRAAFDVERLRRGWPLLNLEVKFW